MENSRVTSATPRTPRPFELPRQAGLVAEVLRRAAAELRRDRREQRAEDVGEAVEPGVPAVDGLGVTGGELGDLGPPSRPVRRELQVAAVGVRHEVRPLGVDLVAVTLEVEVAQDGRRQQAHHVGEHRDLVVGPPRLLGDRGAAHHVPALQDHRALARPGEVGGRDKAVVATADHDGVVGVRGHRATLPPGLGGVSPGRGRGGRDPVRGRRYSPTWCGAIEGSARRDGPTTASGVGRGGADRVDRVARHRRRGRRGAAAARAPRRAAASTSGQPGETPWSRRSRSRSSPAPCWSSGRSSHPAAGRLPRPRKRRHHWLVTAVALLLTFLAYLALRPNLDDDDDATAGRRTARGVRGERRVALGAAALGRAGPRGRGGGRAGRRRSWRHDGSGPRTVEAPDPDADPLLEALDASIEDLEHEGDPRSRGHRRLRQTARRLRALWPRTPPGGDAARAPHGGAWPHCRCAPSRPSA